MTTLPWAPWVIAVTVSVSPVSGAKLSLPRTSITLAPLSSATVTASSTATGASLTAFTVNTNVSLAVSVPSSTVTVIVAVPFSSAAGVILIVRVASVPPRVMLPFGTSV